MIKRWQWLAVTLCLTAGLAWIPLRQDVPSRPIIRLDAGGRNVDGLLYIYCWPRAVGNNQCDFAPQDRPSAGAQIPQGQIITLLIENAPSAPDTLEVTLTHADEGTRTLSLTPSVQALFDEPLPLGEVLFQVDAAFDDVAGLRPISRQRRRLKWHKPPQKPVLALKRPVPRQKI